MTDPPALRVATPRDRAAVSALLARSYPVLLAADYPPDTLAAALPHLTEVRAELLASGRYFVVDAGGVLLAAGGWSAERPTDGGTTQGEGHVRHVVTDPAALRRGLARRIVARAIAEASEAGLSRLVSLSTRTAVPFYAKLGFVDATPGDIALAGGTVFPAVRMIRPI